jgi:ATP-dependent Clp protease ATP-binding subunit ClpC
VFERFTDRSRQVLVLAQEEARDLHHSFIGTEHILLGLLREGDGTGAQALRSLGISLEPVRAKIVESVGRASTAPVPGGAPPFTPRAKKVLEFGLREALVRQHSYIGTEHLLLGLLREGDGVAATVLADLGVTLERARQAVDVLIGEAPDAAEGGVGRVQEVATSPDPVAMPPSCPGCKSLLPDNIRYSVMSVPSDDGASEPIVLQMVYCRRCGTTLRISEPTQPS